MTDDDLQPMTARIELEDGVVLEVIGLGRRLDDEDQEREP